MLQPSVRGIREQLDELLETAQDAPHGQLINGQLEAARLILKCAEEFLAIVETEEHQVKVG